MCDIPFPRSHFTYRYKRAQFLIKIEHWPAWTLIPTSVSKLYDKRDDFDFDIVSFPYLNEAVPCFNSYGVYASQLIRLAIVSNRVTDFNVRNKIFNCKVIGIINFKKRSLNFIADTLNWFLNSRSN